MKRLLSFLLLLLFTLQACNHLSAQIRVACIGNSITYGYKIPAAEAYPVKLQALLGRNYSVKNFGVSGRTMLRKGEAPYWQEDEYIEALDWEPQIVIIKLGTNDARPQNWDNNKGDFYTDYMDFIASFKNLPTKPAIYICYPIPMFTNGSSTEKVLLNEIIPQIKKVARNSGVQLIDLHSPFYGKQHLTYDNVHPTAAGTTLIANEVYKAIK